MSARMQPPYIRASSDAPPLRLEKVRPFFARTAHRIAGHHRLLGFSWNGQPATLSFSALKSSFRPVLAYARVELDGHELLLRIERLPDISSLSASLAGIELDSLPPDLACGVMTVAFESGLRQLKAAGVDLTLLEILPPGGASPKGETLSWAIEKGGDPAWMRGSLSGEDAALEHLATLLARTPEVPCRELAEMAFELTLCTGRLILPLSELAALQPSDALLADLEGWRQQGACEILLSGRRFATASVQGSTLTLQQITMTEPPHPSPATDALVPLDQLEVELTFLVGSQAVTLQQLKSLVPGACFELPHPVGQAVTVCANGRPIGRGELLDIGDRVGVRLTEIAAS